MHYDPARHYRHSIRLKGYDYTRPGAYFITTCTHHRRWLFGRVVGRRLQLTPEGTIVQDVWLNSAGHHPGVDFGSFVVMPDHFHGIVIIRGDGRGVGCRGAAGCRGTACRPPAFGRPIASSIPTIVGAFKSAVTRRINALRGTPGGRVWHINYYERIIPDEEALRRVARYILDNPAKL